MSQFLIRVNLHRGLNSFKLEEFPLTALCTCLSVAVEHLDVLQDGNVGLEHHDARSISFVCSLDGAPLVRPANSHTQNKTINIRLSVQN